jgi:tRNA threonylcarbamoyladenosine biosynthesis protein TsaB
VALVGPDGVIDARAAHVPGGHLEWLIPAVDDLLRASGLSPAAVEGLAVSTGPGGFTGLRIGVVTATAWAVSAGRRVAGVSTLEAIAAGLSDAGLAVAALDARREQVCAALFRVGAGAALRLTPDLLIPPAELAAHLPPGDGPIVLAGDALERHHEALAAALAPRAAVAPRERWWPRAEVVAALGRARLVAGDADDPIRLVPRYARPPVAAGSP